jgi:hypothetical protein
MTKPSGSTADAAVVDVVVCDVVVVGGAMVV